MNKQQTNSFDHAVDCFTTALRAYTKTNSPVQGAKEVQVMISSEPLEQKLDMYKTTLRATVKLVSVSELREVIAACLRELGINHLRKPSGNTLDDYANAVAYFGAALQGYSKTDFPKEWAEVNTDIGSALLALADQFQDGEILRQVVDCYTEAASGFQLVGQNDKASKMRRVATECRKLMSELPGPMADDIGEHSQRLRRISKIHPIRCEIR